MSDEYIEKADLKWLNSGSECGWAQPDMLEWFFPVMTRHAMFRIDMPKKIYSGFLNLELFPPGEFLDYQYIYDPGDFVNLDGHKWKQFRQDIRKYTKTVGETCYIKIQPGEYAKEVNNLLLTWAGEKEFFDNQVMVRYTLAGENRWGLFADGKLVGMNIWDENYMFVNYRYCIDDGSPNLNRFLRHQFYTHPVILNTMKLINDGGSLDDKGLREFKLRLNPIRVETVTSYKQENTNENQ